MDLSDRWASLVSPSPATVATGAALLAAWDQPHRRYHDGHHLAAVLDVLDVLDPVGPGPVGGLRPGAASWSVRVAAWYHDVVYDPARQDNEAESAIRAEGDLLRLGYPRTVAADVARLVVLTADHRAGVGDTGGALLCDADLAVLGRDPDGYAAYVRAVRAEYAHVPAPAWRRGRSAVLRSFLDRPHLYATVTGRELWETPARANLESEMADLAEPPRLPSPT